MNFVILKQFFSQISMSGEHIQTHTFSWVTLLMKYNGSWQSNTASWKHNVKSFMHLATSWQHFPFFWKAVALSLNLSHKKRGNTTRQRQPLSLSFSSSTEQLMTASGKWPTLPADFVLDWVVLTTTKLRP